MEAFLAALNCFALIWVTSWALQSELTLFALIAGSFAGINAVLFTLFWYDEPEVIEEELAEF